MTIEKLSIFDFDGTLFNSPSDTEENKLKYEKETGIPWLIDQEMSRNLSKKHGCNIGIRRGWWGRPETLEPPLVPSPAPLNWFDDKVREDFNNSKKDNSSLTIMLTGRYVKLKKQVCRILHEGNLVKFEVSKDGYYKWVDNDVTGYFLGDNGPKPNDKKPSETFPWKIWIIQQFLDLNKEIQTIEFWEDRDEHVEKFKSLEGTLAKKIIVNHIKY